MGVRGLTSFIKENRRSLTTNVTFDQDVAQRQGSIPVVVDAWGIIYQLYLDSLPWASGGEYLRFYRLVRRLILAWRKVGLEPTFVFDGSAPPEKHETILSRLQQQVSTARLFYTTSPASRSGPSSSRQSCILPPFASHAFIHALESLNVATKFVPLGEADGACVTLADSLGGYVIGLDSDFFILVGGTSVSSNLRGYCPLDMMWWIDGRPSLPSGSTHGDSGWSTAYSRRGMTQNRQSTFLPPANFTKPQLILTCFAPQALRQRLHLPASVLPLFASLCGNDYTPPSASDYFFEPNFTSVQKIEKVARILREQILSPRSSPPKTVHPGDRAVELVKRVIKKLSILPFINDQALRDLVDPIIEATFQYILPLGGECCSTYPFCGELDLLGCQAHNEGSEAPSAIEAYSAAQRRGLMNSITHAWLYPDRVYHRSVVEDPSGPSMKMSEGLQGVRQRAWEIADEGLGGLRWPEPDDVEEREAEDAADDYVGGDLSGGDGNLKGLVIVTETSSLDETLFKGEVGKPKVQPLRGEAVSTAEISLNGSAAERQSVEQDGDKSLPPTTPRTIVEYVRQGSSARIVPHEIHLSPPTLSDIPTCLQPEQTRLQAYLTLLHSNTPAIVALPPHLHPLIAAIRFCLIFTRTDKWRRSEVEAVLKAGLGSFAAWRKDSSCSKIRRDTEEGSYLVLTNRNCALVAQLSATMTDAHLLAQALLLLPQNADVPTDNPGLTHLIPFVFLSGLVLHSLLSGHEMESWSVWRWTETEQETFDKCLVAITEGLENEILGWIRTPPRPTHAVAVGLNGTTEPVDSEGVDKAKRKKKRGKGSKGLGNGRFEVLEGLTA